MVNKKGFVRTLEALIALVLTFLFVVYVLPASLPLTEKEKKLDLLDDVATDPEFQNMALSLNETCLLKNNSDPINQKVKDYFPLVYDYVLCISSDPSYLSTQIPEREVTVNSVFISGNSTVYDPKIIRLYYWTE